MANDSVAGVGEGCESRSDYWRERIRACEASGLSAARFCREQSLSVSGYHWWKRELRRRETTVRSSVAPVPPFAEVHVTPPRPVEAVAIEVVVPGNRRVRVYPGFDDATFAQVLAVLERGGC